MPLMHQHFLQLTVAEPLMMTAPSGPVHLISNGATSSSVVVQAVNRVTLKLLIMLAVPFGKTK